MLESLRNKRIMVIVAHPDDELLGQGATINKLVTEYNCEIRVIILGEGITARADTRDLELWDKELEIHNRNIANATKTIGYHSVSTYDFPDNRFDSVDLLDIIKVIEKEKNEFDPEVIFTHHGGDTNIDHRITFDAVIPAIRPMENEKVRTLISFETPSCTEWQASNYQNYFKPNFFVEVSKENVAAKTKAMQYYEYESRVFPHPRSPEALTINAQRWGIVVGRGYAEAFMIIRTC